MNQYYLSYFLFQVLLETLGVSFIITYATCDLLLSTQEKGALSAIAFAGNPNPFIDKFFFSKNVLFQNYYHRYYLK